MVVRCKIEFKAGASECRMTSENYDISVYKIYLWVGQNILDNIMINKLNVIITVNEEHNDEKFCLICYTNKNGPIMIITW